MDSTLLLFALIDMVQNHNFSSCSGAKTFKGRFDVWLNNNHGILTQIQQEQARAEHELDQQYREEEEDYLRATEVEPFDEASSEG